MGETEGTEVVEGTGHWFRREKGIALPLVCVLGKACYGDRSAPALAQLSHHPSLS